MTTKILSSWSRAPKPMWRSRNSPELHTLRQKSSTLSLSPNLWSLSSGLSSCTASSLACSSRGSATCTFRTSPSSASFSRSPPVLLSLTLSSVRRCYSYRKICQSFSYPQTCQSFSYRKISQSCSYPQTCQMPLEVASPVFVSHAHDLPASFHSFPSWRSACTA